MILNRRCSWLGFAKVRKDYQLRSVFDLTVLSGYFQWHLILDKNY